MKRGSLVPYALLLFLTMSGGSPWGCKGSGDEDLYEQAQRHWEGKLYGMAAQNYEQFSFGRPYHPKAAGSLYKAAFIYAYYLGEFPRAIELLLRLIVLYPESPKRLEAHQELAEIYSTYLKRYPQAISQYEKMIGVLGKKREDLSELYYKIGRCHFLMGDMEKAMKTFEKLLRMYPRGSLADNAAFQMGYIQYLKGSFADAEKALRSFLKEYPDSDYAFDGMLHLAKAKEKQHQSKASRELYEKIRERFPDRFRDVGVKQAEK